MAILKMGDIDLEAKDSAHYHMEDISGISNLSVVQHGEHRCMLVVVGVVVGVSTEIGHNKLLFPRLFLGNLYPFS